MSDEDSDYTFDLPDEESNLSEHDDDGDFDMNNEPMIVNQVKHQLLIQKHI